jgi:hypothetical protein
VERRVEIGGGMSHAMVERARGERSEQAVGGMVAAEDLMVAAEDLMVATEDRMVATEDLMVATEDLIECVASMVMRGGRGGRGGKGEMAATLRGRRQR